MTAISIFPLIIIAAALLIFTVYVIVYMLRINKTVRHEVERDELPGLEEKPQKRLRMPGTSSTGFTILVIATVVCIAVCFIQLNSLKNELHNMSSNYNRQLMALQDQLDSSYDRLEQMLKNKDSLISSYDVKYDGYDKENGKGLVTVTVIPKSITADTEMTLIYLNEEFVGKRNGGRFVFECSITPLTSNEIEEKSTYISITSSGKTSTEAMTDLSYSFGYQHFLPQIYQSYIYPEITGGRMFFTCDDGFCFDLNFENDVTFTEAQIIFEKNAEIFKKIDVSQDFINARGSMQLTIPTPSTKDFPIFSEGDTVKIYLVAKDSAHVTHTCIITFGTIENGMFSPTEFPDENESLSF